MSELKPCPFCGGRAKWKIHYVGCNSCLGRSCSVAMIGNEEDAIRQWNARPTCSTCLRGCVIRNISDAGPAFGCSEWEDKK